MEADLNKYLMREITKVNCMTLQSLGDQMKTKNFYTILLFVVVSMVALWVLSSPTPNLQTIVQKTHSGLKRASSIQLKEQVLTVDPMYLRQLGLMANRGTTDASVNALSSKGGYDIDLESIILPSPKTTLGLPVIASGVRPNHFEEAVVLMKSIHSLLPGYRLVLYDLGLSATEQMLLAKYCNITWTCETVKFQFQIYPTHVKYLNIWSYRPICIQEMLNKYGAVVWVDDGHYFINGNLSLTLTNAKKSGIQGWAIKEPTSSITHPKMFQFFNVDQGSYFFQHAVESSHLVIYNSEKISKHLMLPWVKCALMEECISPTGAQNTGCNYFQRPLYKYTGCHRYDMSALNIILGKTFGFEEEPYTSLDSVFVSLVEDQLRAQNKSRPFKATLEMVHT